MPRWAVDGMLRSNSGISPVVDQAHAASRGYHVLPAGAHGAMPVGAMPYAAMGGQAGHYQVALSPILSPLAACPLLSSLSIAARSAARRRAPRRALVGRRAARTERLARRTGRRLLPMLLPLALGRTILAALVLIRRPPCIWALR